MKTLGLGLDGAVLWCVLPVHPAAALPRDSNAHPYTPQTLARMNEEDAQLPP